jgi:aspartyl-tRNA(Asn)/glutamyl-tRNA(Gln) amidotransferase subunit A
MTLPPRYSATELADQLHEGAITSRQLVQVTLEAIERTDGVLGAFVATDPQGALEQAERVDSARRRGEVLPWGAGLPLAVKDLLCTDRLPTTCGSRMLADYRSPYTATSVARCQAAGLIVVGKTNMDEFGMGGSTETSCHGPTRNPWDTERTPGGSSGGAAACLAAGQISLSLGSDTGGSIRQPAAFCGTCGLKPTYGRVSRYGLVAFASSLDQVGPMANSVEDIALLLQLIAGHDPLDSTSLDQPVPDYRAALKQPIGGFRIGVLQQQLNAAGLDPQIAEAVRRSIDSFRAAGCQIIDVELPHLEYSIPTYYILAPCEASANLARFDGARYGFRASAASTAKLPAGSSSGADDPLPPLARMYSATRGEGFGSEVKRRIMLGTYALSAGYYDAYYKRAQQVRRLIQQDYLNAFAHCDLLLGPVTPTAAYRLGDKLDDPVQMYLGDLFTVGANLAGVPALSVPCGKTLDGLPIGLQLQAPLLEEGRLLAAGYQFQQLFGDSLGNPPVYAPGLQQGVGPGASWDRSSELRRGDR